MVSAGSSGRARVAMRMPLTHAGAAHAGDHRGLDVGHFGDSHDSHQSGSRAARVAIRLQVYTPVT
eukprot:14281740-Ditylum_brightwellii.AAC.1